MRIEDIRRMAHDIIVKGSIENDFIEYKKSVTFKNKFAAIREEEQKKSDVAKEITKEIKQLMKENPTISANEIAETLNHIVPIPRRSYETVKSKWADYWLSKGDTHAV